LISNALELATLQALIDAASQGVIVIDHHGVILLVNEKTEELFGYSREELLGSKLDALLPNASRQAHQRFVQDYFRSPHKRPMGAGLELRGLRKDGAEFPADISLSYAYQDQRLVALALIADISDRKRVEERLLESQRLETAGLLAGGVAHDFNNLLVGIMGNASLLLDSMPLSDPNRPMLESLIRSSERAAELTRQLLAYAGKARFVPKPLNLSHLLEEMKSLLQSATPAHVELVFALDPHLPEVEADAAQLRQIVMSVFANATEAVPQETRGQVRIATYSREGLACIEIHDNGRGMDAETQARIFDPFFTTKFMGRGLGLSAAQGLARGQRGSIEVASAVGEGSTFTITFPILEREARHPVAFAAPAAGARVALVIDDEEVVRNLARIALERHGITVLTAENGQEALEVFSQYKDAISLVLLDLTMPVMGGEETLQRLRAIRPDVAVVLSSGYSEAEALRVFSDKGLAGFVQKPYSAGRLFDILSGIWERIAKQE
jgi:PAS domain S-box-containing protein